MIAGSTGQPLASPKTQFGQAISCLSVYVLILVSEHMPTGQLLIGQLLTQCKVYKGLDNPISTHPVYVASHLHNISFSYAYS